MLTLPTAASETSAVSSTASILPGLCKLSQQIDASKRSAMLPTPGNYTIVLGCNLPLENAKILLSQIQSKGVKDAALFDYRSDNMVVYGSYDNRETAVEQLRSFAADGLTGWIMEVK